MAEAALKIEDEFIRMRRVTRPDLMDKGAWLCGRLKEPWPHLQDRQILGWLITCCDSNEYFFVRTDKAFMLAQMRREFAEQFPIVKEIFCIAELINGNPAKDSDAERFQAQENDSALRQCASLYEDLLRWAQTIGADKIIVDEYSDIRLDDKDKDEAKPKSEETIRKRVNQRLFEKREVFFLSDPERVHKV